MKELNNDNNMCSVAWPLNESEAGIDPVLIGTSLLFLC